MTQRRRILGGARGGSIWGDIWDGVKGVGSALLPLAAPLVGKAIGLGRKKRKGGAKQPWQVKGSRAAKVHMAQVRAMRR